MVCFNNKTCSNRLLTVVIVNNDSLNAQLERIAKVITYRQVYSAIHQTKRICCADHAVKFLDILKFPVKDLNLWVPLKS